MLSPTYGALSMPPSLEQLVRITVKLPIDVARRVRVAAEEGGRFAKILSEAVAKIFDGDSDDSRQITPAATRPVDHVKSR